MKKFISLGVMVSWIILLSMPACRKDSPAVQPPVPPNENKPPLVNAGDPQQINLASCQGQDGVAELDGTGSSDPDGEIKSYDWIILSSFVLGSANPTLRDHTSSRPRLEGLGVGQYFLQLTVTDDKGLAAKDTVSIFVNGRPDEFDLDIAFTVPYQLRDSVANCPWDPGYPCDTFKTTTVEANAPHPVLGILTFHISEYVLTGSNDDNKSFIRIYRGNLNDQFISGRADLYFGDVIQNGQKDHSGQITITNGSALVCDWFYFKNHKTVLSLSAKADTISKTVSLRIIGKLYF